MAKKSKLSPATPSRSATPSPIRRARHECQARHGRFRSAAYKVIQSLPVKDRPRDVRLLQSQPDPVASFLSSIPESAIDTEYNYHLKDWDNPAAVLAIAGETDFLNAKEEHIMNAACEFAKKVGCVNRSEYRAMVVFIMRLTITLDDDTTQLLRNIDWGTKDFNQ